MVDDKAKGRYRRRLSELRENLRKPRRWIKVEARGAGKAEIEALSQGNLSRRWTGCRNRRAAAGRTSPAEHHQND